MNLTKFRYKDGTNASLKAFRAGDFIPEERLSRRNDAIITELFNRTQNGTIQGFYLVDSKYFRAYHRSPKERGKIQLSIGYYHNGELVPTSDAQFETAADAIRYGVYCGNYAIIGG